jgi:hypothetical protein
MGAETAGSDLHTIHCIANAVRCKGWGMPLFCKIGPIVGLQSGRILRQDGPGAIFRTWVSPYILQEAREGVAGRFAGFGTKAKHDVPVVFRSVFRPKSFILYYLYIYGTLEHNIYINKYVMCI